jgi:hypothetical protein
VTIVADTNRLDDLQAVIDRWIDAQLADNPAVGDVARDVDGPRTWFVRLHGEQRDAFTVRFRLDQRTLRYETYFLPAPEENHAAFYQHVLARNLKLYGATFALGDEDAVYLIGQLPHELVCDDELDRVLGSMYAWVEQFFVPALRIGFASRLAPAPADDPAT